MNQFTTKKHFIGVDISNNVLDLAVLNHEGTSFVNINVPNDLKGYDKIISWLDKQQIILKDCAFCMEHTGHYGLIFYAWLSQKKILFCVESGLQIKNSIGMTRGKNDFIDARRIADYLFTHRMKLQPFRMPSQSLLKIKQLLTYREQIIRIRTSLKNSLKSHNTYQKVSNLSYVSEEIKDLIHQQNVIIENIKLQIMQVIENNQELNKNFNLITSVKGVGLVIASFLIVSTNNFTSFENSRKFACYAGIAPFEYSSGSSIRGKTRTSKYGNKSIKSLLNNGANSSVRYDSQMKAYYRRKREEGKDHKLVINAVCCKLLSRVFAVVKRGTPFVDIYRENFVH